jgi:hypothetical protein
MRGFHTGACPKAVANDTSEMSKIEIELAGTVENFMRCEVVEHSSGRAHAIPDFRFSSRIVALARFPNPKQ